MVTEEYVVRRFSKILMILLALAVLASAAAEGSISTTVLMRVSRMTQNAVVNAGEDLTIEVNVDGVSPASYQWFFEGAPIEGATHKVFNLVNAQVDDSGVYRMDAFDADGRMLVSVDFAARVIDDSVPQAGDRSLSAGAAIAAFALCAGLLAIVLRRRALA